MATATWLLLATCAVCILSTAHGYQYIGCFGDGGNRDLPLEIARGSMTAQKCNGLCTGRGYAYFGLQAGNECFCGNSFGKHGPKPTRDCDRECSGDRIQLCGGGWRNSMYTSDLNRGLRFIGCYMDSSDRDLTALVAQGPMSINNCFSACRDRTFAYFGLQHGNECWCGNSFGKYGAKSTEECNMRCSGDFVTLCGAAWRNSVYATGLSPLHVPAASDPVNPRVKDQLGAQIKSQFVAFPVDIMCADCLVASWNRRDVEVNSRTFAVSDLNSVLAGYPNKVRDKVRVLQFGANAKTTFEDFSINVSGSNAMRKSYIGLARRVNDRVELGMMSANVEAQLVTNYNVYHHKVCRKILWIFTKCDTHRIQEARGYTASEVGLIDKALQSETFRLFGEKLSQMTV